jgi:hypothetical protein
MQVQKNSVPSRTCPPPGGDHQLNYAERAIQTFKNHFITVLNGADSNFPAKKWDGLIKQAVMTVIMCRPLHIYPKLSAYQQV